MNTNSTSLSLQTLKLVVLLAGVFASLGGSQVWAATPGPAWGENYFPNVELVTQDGEKVRFYDDLIKDKVFAISFIYTRCTASCPMATSTMKNLQKALGDKLGKDVMLYSISIDGDTDNPAELKQYAEKFHAAPGWTFLTGRPEDVVLLRKKLGVYRADGQAEQLSEHGVSIVMGNERAGQWIKRSPFEDSKALMRVLVSRLADGKSGRPALQVAEREPAKSKGEVLFRGYCEACHSLGTQDGIGPGLSGVLAKRDLNWLKRWIKQPDSMIAAKDPDAIALYQQYKQLPMPNMRLSDADVEAILNYLQQQEALGSQAHPANPITTPGAQAQVPMSGQGG